MFGQLDTVRHPEVGLGSLLVMVVLTASAIAAADDIALVPLMTADDIGIGIALVVLFARWESVSHERHHVQKALEVNDP
jgi:hypothetical protein